MSNHAPDDSIIKGIEDRLKAVTKKLHDLAPLVGAAETVIEFNSDQRKVALAQEAKRYIERGESVAGADTLARSSPVYTEKMKELETNFTEAQRIKYEWKANMCSFEAARSLLARQRETLHTFQE
jgi:hypothetical protein